MTKRIRNGDEEPRFDPEDEYELQNIYGEGLFVDQILALDSFDYEEDEEDLLMVVPAWAQSWPGVKHEKDMPDGWFMLSTMDCVTLPNSRFRTAAAARKYFTEKYRVVCVASSARFWCCVVMKDDESGAKDAK